jgi:methylenetetrahydrofolate dehydrogenase (NADP+)/methenyltetrahydrofolate cyclohydrolase
MSQPIIHDGLIDGNLLAAQIRDRIRHETQSFASDGVVLTLAVVRVGEDPASKVYVRNKIRACADVGITSRAVELPESTSEAELLAVIAALNADDSVDGILVQLPLPRHIVADRVLHSVSPKKDADGFHPANLGELLVGTALLEPCTPRGVMAMLRAAGVALDGAEAVVVGRSVIVGRTVAQMLVRENATVTICHRHTRDLRGHVERADVLIVATGVPGLIPGEWVKQGATVIDVGINRTPDGKLCGDVVFETARERAALITPVPGGVGPMTVAMLLWNTLLAGRVRRQLDAGGFRGPYLPL